MASVSSDLATTVSAEEGSRIVFHPPLLRTHPGHAIPYITLTMMAIVLGIVGNILILVVFSKYKKLDRNGNEFMINLAIADLFVTAIADPMCIVGAVGGEEFFSSRLWLCEVIAAMCLTACFCAFVSLTSVTIARYMMVCHRKLHTKYFTNRTRNIIMCVFIWIVSFGFEIGNFLGWGDHYFDVKNHSCIWDRTKSASYTYFVALVLIMGPIFLMTFLDSRIVWTIYKSKKKMVNQQANGSTPESVLTVKAAWKETTRSARSLIIVFVAFVICWVPYTMVIIFDINDNLSFEVHLWVTWLAHLHSAINFTVYLLTYEMFRDGLKWLFGRKNATPGELKGKLGGSRETMETSLEKNTI